MNEDIKNERLHWIEANRDTYKCSNCGCVVIKQYERCPLCREEMETDERVNNVGRRP